MDTRTKLRIKLEAWRDSPVALLVAMSGALLILLAVLTALGVI